MSQPTPVTLLPLAGIPLIAEGDDLGAVLGGALEEAGLALADGDVLVLAQKIVSKAEGRLVPLADVTPGPRAVEIGQQCDKDPRLVELILSEADEVMRVRKGVLIVRHRLGLVLANAGIDQSNVDQAGGPVALLLPLDPDATCQRLRAALAQRTGKAVAVIIIDSLGRAWRSGTLGTAIGVAGLPALLDLRGRPDLYGRNLETSELGLADEVAAAASLVMGQAAEGTPAVLVRGLALPAAPGSAADLVRPRALDLFP
ncbi:coenzyme F420-0:L-glutamate ligase [Novosphingobium bradum]|uniref:Coenzyme F420-0:L-glutamate ligase n=1 Tax=Novosphingobium bradum TaxID=1737444 RepID=A0ABV7IPN0_9SPHN